MCGNLEVHVVLAGRDETFHVSSAVLVFVEVGNMSVYPHALDDIVPVSLNVSRAQSSLLQVHVVDCEVGIQVDVVIYVVDL